MARTQQDADEERVRVKYANFLSEAGVSDSRIALEILFMLPAEFVRAYAELFDMSLKYSGGGGGGPKDEGHVKAKGSVGARDPLNARTIRGAQGNGKRWRQLPFSVKSETALVEKTKLDRRLVDAVNSAIREARAARLEKTAETNEKSGRKGRKGSGVKCPQCGRGQGKGWLVCPFDGARFQGVGSKRK